MVKLLGSNLSEKYKCEWVAPERTGSRKVAEILSYYGFTNNGSPLYRPNNHAHSHQGPNEALKDYTLICNARNPYGRTYSIYKNFFSRMPENNDITFKVYLQNHVKISRTFRSVVNPTFDKLPDYIIRLENMFDDLLKLPFISDSLSKKQLEMLCHHEKPIEDWEQFYDEESKEIVYNLTKHHFDIWGYEK